ncbi:50S ribosomal protein L20 [Patescibacteria group bacterium]|nr:50S ribosomal protein L20 [Patescibacteria group bacterium]
MARVKRGTTAKKRRKNILKKAKGFRWGRSKKYRLAKDALRHAWVYSFRDRKTKKRSYRKLWETKISGGVREQGLTYSKFLPLLKKQGIALDRKILAELREKHPQVFQKIVEQVKEK